MSPGSATVRATLSGKTASANVTVGGATLRSIALALGDGPPASRLPLSGPGPFQLRAVGTFSDGKKADVTGFCTYSPAVTGPGVIATVSNVRPGLITVAGHGTQTVTATYSPTFIGQPTVTGTVTVIVP